MAKYSFNFKLEVVQFYLTGKSYQATAGHFKIVSSAVKKWVKFYEIHGVNGIKPRRTKSIYSAQFKLQVLTFMAQRNLSLMEAATHFNIPAFTSILEWKSLFKQGDLTALESFKKCRPKQMEPPKKIVPKTDIEKTKDEFIAELAYLQAENDVLKKYQEMDEEEEQQRCKLKLLKNLKKHTH